MIFSTRFILKLPTILVGSLLLFASQAKAENSIWFKDADTLHEEWPAKIPNRFLNNEQGLCVTPDLNNFLDLGQITNMALCNNPQTREIWSAAKVQAAQLGVAQSAYYFNVTNTLTTNTNYTDPRLASRKNPYENLNNNLVASYLLYDFGNRNASLENARQLLQAAGASQDATLQNLLLNTSSAFYQVQASIAALDAAVISEQAAEQSFRAAEAKYQVGTSTPADKLQAQTALAQASLARISAEGNLKNSYGALANLMGLNANSNIKIKPSPAITHPSSIENNIETLLNEAMSSRPDLMASEAQVKAAEASILVSYAATKPTVSLSLSNGWQEGTQYTHNNTSSLGVSVTIPIFNGYAPSHRIQAAIANADIKIAQRDQLKLQVSLDVWSAFNNLKTAIESMKAATTLVESASESSRVALGRYKAGVGNIIDTLNAQSALASARQQQIQATLNWNIAKVTMAQAIGGLDNLVNLPSSKFEN